jgi:Carbon-nitrogen hydrolase
VPVTTTQRPHSRWELLLRARAVENVMFVAAANRVDKDKGGAPEAFYFGESLIVDPRGDAIGHGSASQEDLVVAELDLECLKTQRKSRRFFEDRRPEGYGAISAVCTAPVARSRQMAIEHLPVSVQPERDTGTSQHLLRHLTRTGLRRSGHSARRRCKPAYKLPDGSGSLGAAIGG